MSAPASIDWPALIARVHAGERARDVAREHGIDRRALSMRALNADPARNPLVLLTAAERADYDLLMRNGYSRVDALTAIGRSDLIRGAA